MNIDLCLLEPPDRGPSHRIAQRAGWTAHDEYQERLQQVGPNLLKPRRHDTALHSFIAQFSSPLILILVFAAVVSTFAGECTHAAIVVASVVLSLAQEYTASNGVEKLRAQVTIKATLVRDGTPGQV